MGAALSLPRIFYTRSHLYGPAAHLLKSAQEEGSNALRAKNQRLKVALWRHAEQVGEMSLALSDLAINIANLIVNSDGTTKTDISGFPGPSCLDAAAPSRDLLAPFGRQSARASVEAEPELKHAQAEQGTQRQREPLGGEDERSNHVGSGGFSALPGPACCLLDGLWPPMCEGPPDGRGAGCVVAGGCNRCPRRCEDQRANPWHTFSRPCGCVCSGVARRAVAQEADAR